MGGKKIAASCTDGSAVVVEVLAIVLVDLFLMEIICRYIASREVGLAYVATSVVFAFYCQCNTYFAGDRAEQFQSWWLM